MPIRPTDPSDRWDAKPVSPDEVRRARRSGKEIPVARPIGIPESTPPVGHLVEKARGDVRRLVDVPPDAYEVTEEDLIPDERDLMRMPVTLPDDVFRKLFPGKVLPRQYKAGNCWAVAALGVFRNYPYFRAIVQRSVREIHRGGTLVGWAVRVPLGSPYSRKEIGVSRDELTGETMDAPLGFHILEAVIAKHEVRSKRKQGISLHRADGKLNIRPIMQGGMSDEALGYLLGKYARATVIGLTGTSLSASPREVRRQAIGYLQHFDPRRDIATFSTARAEEQSSHVSGLSYRFRVGHSYALLGVDAAEQTVTVQDPNREDAIILGWKDAFDIFSLVRRVRLFDGGSQATSA